MNANEGINFNEEYGKNGRKNDDFWRLEDNKDNFKLLTVTRIT